VWWIDSAHSGSSGQAIKNLGWGGAALDATAGSTTSADSNDPKYLDWDGRNYVYTPGGAVSGGTPGNLIAIPDSAALDITGDIDVRCQIAPDDWTPSASMYVLSKFATGGNLSYILQLNNTGTLNFTWSANGSTSISANSTISNTFTDGTIKWIRATLDVDNGASGNDVKFFTSDDGIVWTQLGSTVTTAGVTSIYAGTAEIALGQRNIYDANAPFVGKYFRAQILSGIDGVPILDVDTSVVSTGAATSFTALTGQTATIYRYTSGRKTTCVTHPVWLFGTDDYMEVNNRWLERTSANYLYLPGVASNYASAPDSAALDVTGDIDLRVKVALDDWTPAAITPFITKWAASNYSYFFNIATDGKLQLFWTANGSTTLNVKSTVVPTVTDGSTLWVRVTLDVDNGASGNDVVFYTSPDGTTWTQLGTTVTTAGTTSIYSGTAALFIGAGEFGGTGARGKFFRAQVLNGIGGTVAFDANFESSITSNLPTTFTESSTNAATVTINYSGTGFRSAGVIASTYVFPGNPNTFKLSAYSLLDFGATDSFTALIVSRQANYTATQILMNKGLGLSSTGYVLRNATGAPATLTGGFNDPTIQVGVTGGSRSNLALVNASLVRNTSTDNGIIYTNATAGTAVADSTTGSLSTVTSLVIGSTGSISNYADMELYAAAVFRRALTSEEITTLNSYFQGRAS
jgi:hypothetical protein